MTPTAIYIDHAESDSKVATKIAKILMSRMDKEEDKKYLTISGQYSIDRSASDGEMKDHMIKVINETDIFLFLLSEQFFITNFRLNSPDFFDDVLKIGNGKFLFPIVIGGLTVSKYTGNLSQPNWFSKFYLTYLNNIEEAETALNELNILIHSFAKYKYNHEQKIHYISKEYEQKIIELKTELLSVKEEDKKNQNLLQECIEMLSKNKIKEIITLLNSNKLINSNSSLKKRLINYSSRFYRLNELRNSRTLNQDEIFIEANKINEGLLDIVNSLELTR